MAMKLMNGTYYLVVGGLDEDYINNIKNTIYTDKKIIEYAWGTERSAYKNTYNNGVLIESIRLHDNGDGYRYEIGSKNHYEPLDPEMRYRYQMLGRLKADCEYFLGNGNRYEGHLWAKNVDDQIKEMRERWLSLADDVKPEWLSWEDIDNYEKEMKGEDKNVYY